MPSLKEFIEIEQRDALGITARIELRRAPWAFEGHFPAKALLPGVIQLAWVRELCSLWLDEPCTLQGVPQMKFVKPVIPEDTLRLTLSRAEPNARKIAFTYDILLDAQALAASHGKVELAPHAL